MEPQAKICLGIAYLGHNVALIYVKEAMNLQSCKLGPLSQIQANMLIAKGPVAMHIIYKGHASMKT